MVEEGAGGRVESGEEGDFGEGDAVGFDVVSVVREISKVFVGIQ